MACRDIVASAVAQVVVGHAPVRSGVMPWLGEVGRGAERGTQRRWALLVGQDLGVGQPGVVVDQGVHVVVADSCLLGRRGRADLAAVGSPAAAVGDPAEFLDVHVDQLAGPVAFVADRGRLRGPDRDGARRALDAAGIATTVDDSVVPSAAADEVLAWVVREGATNVLRHSGASACRIALTDVGGRIALTIADDGVGGPSDAGVPDRRAGGAARPRGLGGGRVGRGAEQRWVPAGRHPPRRRLVIRVLLAEDQAMMRGALAVLLDLEDDLEVVAQVSDGADIVPTALEVRPDVALLDIELPHVSGLEAAAALTEALPECRVVMVTTFGRPGYLQRAMAAGAAGFLVKDGPVEGLADAIRKVAGGATVVDPELAGKALRTAVSPLTPRERDVLAAAEDGSTVADIAGRLHLSASTVRNYLSDAIGKTGTRNRTEAALLARRNGWL